ncbi:pentapeptide repeat-containing protein [Flavobacterium inviolabile]|uniref:pentapeptide repeat-containing protein n=1 Tax=Flavobacterium inviolabile TaxID=2748320 RepID=UPI0015A81170|nr:pentapeptide repeat-containing protein [Flavobacterium inviolabile]
MAKKKKIKVDNFKNNTENTSKQEKISCCNFDKEAIIDIIIQKLNKQEDEKRRQEDEKRKQEDERRKHAEQKFKPTNRKEIKDFMFYTSDKKNGIYFIQNIQYVNYLLVRCVATNFLFENIDFSKTIFDSCYLKDCRFINCKFEGAKFINCNLQGSYFELCNFDYVIFEKTFVDDEIFECAPKKDNLKYKFARSLKLNYASIGDYIKASKAVSIELDATKSHLKDSWLSGDEWYKKKYGGIKRRTEQFIKWCKVCALDFVWGNGESLKRLIRFNIIIFFILTLVDATISKNKYGFFEFINTFLIKVPCQYLGITVKNESNIEYFSYYPNSLNLFLIIVRMISFGLLMSIIIKKYNRR